MLKEPIAMEFDNPLAVAGDETLDATLEWVIVKDGPGTWAKNAWWDQYLLNVRNTGAKPLTLTNVQVVDSLETVIESEPDRRSLVRGSKQTQKRYGRENIDVRPGAGVGTIVAVGAGTMIYGVGMAGAIAIAEVITPVATLGAGTFTASSVATSMATAGMIAGPVLIVGGLVKAANNERVDEQIGLRQTSLPLTVEPGAEQKLDIFFPVTPSPRAVRISYEGADGSEVLEILTGNALSGLHVVKSRRDELSDDPPVASQP
ncbi:MAG: hypothetical protein AAF417_18950 [Pseudomonadota bacterium]